MNKVNKKSFVSSFLAAAMVLAFIQNAAAASPPAQPKTQSPDSPLIFAPPRDPDKGRVLQIPKGKASEIDGVCTDYTDAQSEAFADGGGITSTVYFKHDGSYLYVCMVATLSKNNERFGRLYLDPQGDGSSYTFADKTDYALQVNLDSSNKSFHGTGVSNGYDNDTLIPAFWDGKYAISPTGGNEDFEYRVSLGRFKMGDCGQTFGIAAYHHWFSAVGDDYGYPSNQWFDQPGTWAAATLLSPPCSTPEPMGKIAYVYRGNTADATTFRNLLISRGFTVQLVPLSNVLTTDFSLFDLTIIAEIGRASCRERV